MTSYEVASLIVLATLCFAFLMWLCAALFMREIEAEINVSADDSQSAEIEKLAEAIYERSYSIDTSGKYRPWIPGGNSLKQEEARRDARKLVKP